MDENHPTPPNPAQPPYPPRQFRSDEAIEKRVTPLAYKIVSIVIVVAMLATLIFPALIMLRRSAPDNCHRGPFGPIHCHTEPIDHHHSIFT